VKYICFDDIESLTEEWFNNTLPSVSEQRQKECMRYKFYSGRALSLKVYEILKECLREEFCYTENPSFTFLEHGKPVIEERPDIHFSMSHCKSAVASVASHSPVGIDVESIRPLNKGLMTHVLNDQEIEKVMNSASPDAEFIKYWTMKESLSKLTGKGIGGHSLKTILDEPFAKDIKFESWENTEKHYILTIARY